MYGIFVVLKDDGGGGRSVVDCSKPPNHSVNSCTSSVAPKFKYKGLDDVVEHLERGIC